jgi:hypothetical protein
MMVKYRDVRKVRFYNERPHRAELLLASGESIRLVAGIFNMDVPVKYANIGSYETELEFEEPLPTCLYDTVSRVPSDLSTLTCKRVIKFEHIKYEPEVRG